MYYKSLKWFNIVSQFSWNVLSESIICAMHLTLRRGQRLLRHCYCDRQNVQWYYTVADLTRQILFQDNMQTLL